MKVTVDDLKKALDWIRTNSNDVYIQVDIVDGLMYFKCEDKYKVSVEIKVYKESSMMPKITKEDIL